MKKSLFYFICIVTTLVGIFLFSSQNFTNTIKTSDTIVKPIENRMKAKTDKTFDTEKAEKDYWKNMKGKLDKLVRKSAHGIIFGILGFFTMLFFKSVGMKTGDAVVLTMVFCGFYAGSDELHQRFVKGRDCRFEDVCIDMFGAWIAVLGVYLWDKLMPFNKAASDYRRKFMKI